MRPALAVGSARSVRSNFGGGASMSASRIASLGSVGVLLVVVACSSSTTGTGGSSGSDDISQADADAIAATLMADVQGSGLTDINTKTIQPLGDPPPVIDVGLDPQAKCTPERLTPVQQCRAGGNMYTTINQSCPSGTEANCC